MRVLVVAATDAEIAPLAASSHARRGIDFISSGVGMVATAARVSRALAIDQYDLALNLGVCGSFNPAFPAGTVVHIVSDCIAELGAEDGDRVLTLDEMNVPGQSRFENASAFSSATLAALPRVSAITVNTVHGNDQSIARTVARFHPDVESMEGAAFMYACQTNGIRFAQVRAVSNVVERRNRQAWKLEPAIENLTRTACAILDEL
jgi:futalosine hydrolase